MSSRRMTNEQYLYSESVYSLSRVLEETWDALYTSPRRRGASTRHTRPLVVPALFNKHSRTFHQMTVASDRWTFDGPLKLQDILTEMWKNPTPWKQFSEEMAASPSESIREALDCVNGLLTASGLFSHSAEELGKCHAHLLSLHTEYPHAPDLNLDGIIYRNLIKLHKNSRRQRASITYAQGLLRFDLPCSRYAWAEMTFYDEKGAAIDDLLPFQCQDAFFQGASAQEVQQTSHTSRPGFDFAAFLLRKFSLESLQPPGSREIERRYFLILPLYDAFVGGEAWGSLWGNLILLFDTPRHQASFVKTQFRDLIRELDRFIYALGQSAVARILAEPLRNTFDLGYDLIEHFVRNIVWLQDWERVMVYQQPESDSLPLYCYSRQEDPARVETAWVPCGCLGEQPRCAHGEPWHKVSQGSGEGGGHVDHPFLCWGTDLWEATFLPDLSGEERQAFGGIRFVFEYPRSAVVPNDRERRNALDEFYTRQQLAILRDLTPKVRARRSALRTATVAIMGRNMSHNIGSHVLARLGIQHEIEALVKRDSNSGQEPEERYRLMLSFLAHLQERMDFLAEISTTVPFFSFPIWIRRDVITPFQRQQRVLLDRISGIPEVEAQVELRCSEKGIDRVHEHSHDFRYGSAGGRLGAQALYVILENVMRNTAKHSLRQGQKTVSIDMCVREHSEDLYEVRIWDLCGNAKQPVNGKPLVDYLNDVIHDPIIEPHGEVRPQNWGVREMLICAAYLRQVPLEDLEKRQPTPPLLEAVRMNDAGDILKDNSSNGNLGYRFFLPRPKELLILGSLPGVEEKQLESCRQELRRTGIEIVTESGLVKKILSQGGVSHAFLMWLNPDTTEYDAARPSMPVRVLTRTTGAGVTLEGVAEMDEEFVSSLGQRLVSGKGPEVLKDLWRQWCAYLWRRRLASGGSEEDLPQLFNTINAKACGIRHKKEQGFESWAVIYDRHGSLDQEVHEGKALCQPIVFWEPYRHDETQAALFQRPPDDKVLKDILGYQFLEAGLVRVAILDERVQDGVKGQHVTVGQEHHQRQAPLQEVLRNMGVFVPEKDSCDLDRPAYQQIETWVKTQCIGFDFLVIHQGVLDRLRDQVADLRAWIERLVHNDAKIVHLVVCSGRGIPSGMSSRFVPLSSVLKWTMQTKSKYHLCQLLSASRRPRYA